MSSNTNIQGPTPEAYDTKNHPGTGSGTTPNWFFYWAQTSANLLNTTTDYIGSARSHYDYFDNRKIKLGDDCAGTQIAAWGTPKGIDCYAWTTGHESKHHIQITSFWPTNWNGSQDSDSDWLPNSQETTYMPGRNYDPINAATFPDSIGYGENPIRDVEDIAMRSQNSPYGLDKLWTNGAADSEDWASPGKNVKNKF
jgi:hypothetical protein